MKRYWKKKGQKGKHTGFYLKKQRGRLHVNGLLMIMSRLIWVSTTNHWLKTSPYTKRGGVETGVTCSTIETKPHLCGFTSKNPKQFGFSSEMSKIAMDTLPETNMAPENNPWKRRFLLETIIFRGYVSFREGNFFSYKNVGAGYFWGTLLK